MSLQSNHRKGPGIRRAGISIEDYEIVMLLVDIIPFIDTRKLNRIPGNSPLISAINQLRENRFVPLLVELPSQDPSKPRVISGFSIISKLAELPSSSFAAYLKSPVSESTLAIGSIDEQHDIISLFHVFETTSLGFAEVRKDNRPTQMILSLRSFLSLYESGVFSSSLTLGEVASAPVFSLSRGTKFDQTLREMLRRKFRRVQIAGTRAIVSDGEVLAYLFNEDRLKKVAKSPERLLDGTLEEIEGREASWLESSRKLRDAAKDLLNKDHETVLTDRGLITPWDLTLKPWRLGELEIAEKPPVRK